MNINLLKNALIAYKESNPTVEDDVNKYLAELTDIKNRLCDIWTDNCYVVSPDLVYDAVVDRTYDAYTGLYVRKGYKQPSYEEYYDYCRKHVAFTDVFTDEMLETGYELVADTFEDNIRNGHHDKNGMPL